MASATPDLQLPSQPQSTDHHYPLASTKLNSKCLWNQLPLSFLKSHSNHTSLHASHFTDAISYFRHHHFCRPLVAASIFHSKIFTMCYIDGTVRQYRSEELPSPIDLTAESGRVSDRGPPAPASVADTDVSTRRPVMKVGSRSSHSSLLRKAAMNEVRRAFFTSDSSSSLADDTSKSKTSIKDSEDAGKIFQSPEFADPVSGRLQSILWLYIAICVFRKTKLIVRFAANRLYNLFCYDSASNE